MEEKEKNRKYMKSIKLTLALAFALAAMPLASRAYVWSSCAQWGTYTSSGYTFYCDEWGSTASECCNLNSITSWNVVSSVPTGGGVKGYPNTARASIGKTVNNYSGSGSWNGSEPSGTYWDLAYDIWVPREVMVWVNWSSGVGPWGTYTTTVSLDGQSWDVYVASGGPVNFLRKSHANSGSVNLSTLIKWGVTKGYYSGTGTINGAGIGFEIFGSGSSHTWYMNSCSIGT
jgi:hypothetical protein